MNKADRIALHALLTLAGIVGLVIAIARIVSAVQSETGKPVVAVAGPTPTATPEPVRREANPSPEPEVRRAIPVAVPTTKPVAMRPSTPRPTPEPTPWPAEITLDVRHDEWSRVVTVPPGKQASVEFTLGRITIERNGAQVGTFSHPVAGEPQHLGSGVAIVPYRGKAQPVHLDARTRTLRVMAAERRSGTVVIRFFD